MSFKISGISALKASARKKFNVCDCIREQTKTRRAKRKRTLPVALVDARSALRGIWMRKINTSSMAGRISSAASKVAMKA